MCKHERNVWCHLATRFERTATNARITRRPTDKEDVAIDAANWVQKRTVKVEKSK